MKILTLLAFALFTVTPAMAQRFDNYQTNQRLSQIEQSLTALQQQMMQQNSPGANSAASRVGAELGRIEEQIRLLNGKVEELQYQVDQANNHVKRMQEDNDFRFKALEAQMGQGAAYSAMPVTMPAANAEPTSIMAPPRPPMPASLPMNTPPATTTSGQATLTQELQDVVAPTTSPTVAKLERPVAGGAGTPTPREVYNHSFALLNQTDYAGAEKGFVQFIHQFPSDPLIGNAWYWLGESHYVRRDYVKAADSFRQGFEVAPDGPKSGDNLLKLAMSLAALERGKEACIVLRQVDKKYAANSEDLKEKTRQELNRMNCP